MLGRGSQIRVAMIAERGFAVFAIEVFVFCGFCVGFGWADSFRIGRRAAGEIWENMVIVNFKYRDSFFQAIRQSSRKCCSAFRLPIRPTRPSSTNTVQRRPFRVLSIWWRT